VLDALTSRAATPGNRWWPPGSLRDPAREGGECGATLLPSRTTYVRVPSHSASGFASGGALLDATPLCHASRDASGPYARVPPNATLGVREGGGAVLACIPCNHRPTGS
jgi:hypothetical protein